MIIWRGLVVMVDTEEQRVGGTGAPGKVARAGWNWRYLQRGAWYWEGRLASFVGSLCFCWIYCATSFTAVSFSTRISWCTSQIIDYFESNPGVASCMISALASLQGPPNSSSAARSSNSYHLLWRNPLLMAMSILKSRGYLGVFINGVIHFQSLKPRWK